VLAPPGPVAVPAVELLTPDLEDGSAPLEFAPPSSDAVVDELMASPVLRDPEFLEAVQRWVVYWSVSAARSVPDFLRRMGAFEASVDSVLASEDMPPSLRYLPFIESGYNPGARSRATAVGMWQFMEGTAQGFGMTVSPSESIRPQSPSRCTGSSRRGAAAGTRSTGIWVQRYKAKPPTATTTSNASRSRRHHTDLAG
jgi:hypothetical protein